MKAFKITVRYYPNHAFYCGETASKARYAAFLDISDMHPDIKIMDVNVRRAPEHDHLAQLFKRARTIHELV